MTNKIWHVIGLMSGTSLDGVDLAYVKFTREKEYFFEILKTESLPYSEKWKKMLFEAFDDKGENLTWLSAEFGRHLGARVNEFRDRYEIEKIDFVASHGHTIFHRPDRGYTLQIGDGEVLAAETGLKVICDFRSQDLALGGQGAPLVPIGDELLFREYDFCLNIGGFANVSYNDGSGRKAFDICPANIVLNTYTRKAGFEFDDRGRMAAGGKLDPELLTSLNEMPFYKKDQPKSLGYEYVVEHVLPLIDSLNLDLNDILCTYVEHIAFQISSVVERAAQNLERANARLLVTGGGAFNDYLVERLEHLCAVEVSVPDREIIEFKEALIFAFLGVLKDQQEVNCLKSVTGARKDHSSGVVYEC
jgi:anhydro-N-acetylmuramic acid kinase